MINNFDEVKNNFFVVSNDKPWLLFAESDLLAMKYFGCTFQDFDKNNILSIYDLEKKKI